MDMPENYEQIQRRFTSNSRGTRMGRRVLENVKECAKYLDPKIPTLCVGCGDGYEIECLQAALSTHHIRNNIATFDSMPTIDVVGIEVSQERVNTAKKRGFNVFQGTAEDLHNVALNRTKYNIYCAHTLEHCYDQSRVFDNFKKICANTIVIIVPIESRGKSPNKSHYTPIPNLGSIAIHFGMGWRVVNLSYRHHLESEGLLVLTRD